MNRQEKKLLAIFRQLSAEDAQTLEAFAAFLQQRGNGVPAVPSVIQAIPRPEAESVVAAIKRLTATYPMLDTTKILDETSGLMSQHIIQGRPAIEVIDDLEQLFRRHYDEFQSNLDKTC